MPVGSPSSTTRSTLEKCLASARGVLNFRGLQKSHSGPQKYRAPLGGGSRSVPRPPHPFGKRFGPSERPRPPHGTRWRLCRALLARRAPLAAPGTSNPPLGAAARRPSTGVVALASRSGAELSLGGRGGGDSVEPSKRLGGRLCRAWDLQPAAARPRGAPLRASRALRPGAARSPPGDAAAVTPSPQKGSAAPPPCLGHPTRLWAQPRGAPLRGRRPARVPERRGAPLGGRGGGDSVEPFTARRAPLAAPPWAAPRHTRPHFGRTSVAPRGPSKWPRKPQISSSPRAERRKGRKRREGRQGSDEQEGAPDQVAQGGPPVPRGPVDPASTPTRLLAPGNASNASSNASKSPDRRLNRRPAGSTASSNCA